MAVLTKYNAFIDEESRGGHNLQTAVFKAALTNTPPNAASDTTASYPPPAAVDGYPAGGATLTTLSASTTGGLFTLVLQDYVFTAGPGGIGPFRYIVLYDSSAGNKVIGYYDRGASVMLNNADTFTTDFDNVAGALTLA